jgi:hypothetical protein
MAHELGHNHGRMHTDCGGPDQPDPDYPYSGGEVGVFGWDSRENAIYPTDRTDIMGYCQNKWFSDYTYQALLEKVRQVNSTQSILLAPGTLSTFRVLLVQGTEARWGHPIDEPSPPAGEPESAEVLDAAGNSIASITVYRTRIGDIDASSIEVPPPSAGWHSVKVAGAPAHPF